MGPREPARRGTGMRQKLAALCGLPERNVVGSIRRTFRGKMIDIYTWPTPNGHKVHIMLEETGLPYRVHGINIRTGDQFKPEFLEISPNNRIPAIVDHEGPNGKPISLFESGAILIYLAGKTGKLLPLDLHQRYAALEWLMWQMGGIGPMFGQANHFRAYSVEKITYAIERYTNEANRLTHVMDKRLAATPYLAGDDYSVADIAVFRGCVMPTDAASIYPSIRT
jgi:GST-like protein